MVTASNALVQVVLKGRNMEEDKEMCCVCARKGKTSKLKTYQINFEEAIRFCEDDECTYPAGMDNSSWVLNRKFSELQVSKPPVIKKKSLPQRPQYHAEVKSANYRYGPQKSTTKSPVCMNPARVKSSLGINQHHLKNGQNVRSPSTSLTKTEETCLAPNNEFGSRIQYPAYQQPTVSVAQSKETVTPKLKEENKSACKPNINKSDTARQSMKYESEKYSPSAVDQLRVFYPQWQNKDALCWMDVILCLLVHCKQVNKLKCGDPDSDPSIVCTLLKAYDQALSLLNEKSISSAASPYDVDVCVTKSDNTKVESQINSPSTLLFEEKEGTGCNDEDKSNVISKSVNISLQEDEVKTGAGLQLLKSDLVQLMLSHGDSEYSKAFDLLTDIREQIWHQLHPRLRCKKGKNDSPVFAIPLLTKNSKDLEQLLAIKYSFRFSCTKCGFQDVLQYEKVLPTFPNTTPDFSMTEPKFLRPCFKCNVEGQLMTMVFERLPPVVMLHFQEGLHHNNFSGYDFRCHDQLYQVTGVIQYRNDPDHFIAWIRNTKEELWMECNDLKSPVCQFDQPSPSFPASQVHIVMWEAVSIEDGRRAQNGSRLVCTEDLAKIGRVDTSMGNGCMNESNLRSSVSEKVDYMYSVLGNSNNMNISTPNQSGSLPTPKTQRLTPTGQHQFQTSALKMSERSKVIYQTPAKNMRKVVNVASIQKPAEIRNLQQGNVSKRILPGAKNNMVYTPNSVHLNQESTRSTPTDKILEKTKNHVSLLRNMKNRRISNVPNESLSQQKKVPRPEGLQSPGSLSFLSQILSNAKNKTPVTPIIKGKVFEGYRSKVSDASSFASKNRTRSTSSEIDTESLTSRPNSPALSCHSDSVVIQKRKTELVSENIMLPVLKRRRSQDTNFTSVHLPFHNKSLSLDAATTHVTKRQVSTETSMNDSSVEVATDNNQCSNSELFASANRNDGTIQESDILQNLYSALNIAMPAHTDESKSPIKMIEDSQMDVENFPDVSELDKFINSDCDSNMQDNFDNFLSEL